MTDFITLSCPACGGTLKIDKDAKYFTCEYCGRYHIIQPEDNEFYAKCPLCKRNDKVEKVTTKFIQYSQRFPQPESPEQTLFYSPKPQPKFPPKPKVIQKPADHFDEFKKNHSSIIKQDKDYQKTKAKKGMRLFILLIIPPIFVVSLFATVLNLEKSFLQDLLLSIELFLGAYWVFALFSWFLSLLSKMSKAPAINKKLKAEYDLAWQKYEKSQQELTSWNNEVRKLEEAQQEWEIYKTNYDLEFNQKKAQMMKAYEIALDRYNQSYYCQRDDCIFIPGEPGYAPSSRFTEFLYQDN